MSDYFESIRTIKGEINKYVHKQGFKTFYISQNHPLSNNNETEYVEEFEYYLRKCIGVVAILRLSIDPFPLLLADENIYHRTGDLMTKAYSNDFVEKYIGYENVENYKTTTFYQSHYDSIIQEEKKDPCVTQVVKNQYIDKDEIDNILSQQHLLSQDDLLAVLLTTISESVAKIYCIGGLLMYFTSTQTQREIWSWSSKDFNKFEQSDTKFNQKYDEAFISCVEINNEVYFIEHNRKLEKNELYALKELKNKYEERYRTINH